VISNAPTIDPSEESTATTRNPLKSGVSGSILDKVSSIGAPDSIFVDETSSWKLKNQN